MSLDLDTWAQQLVESLVGQLRAALRRVVGDTGREDVVGVGVYTDVDARSVVAAALTRAHWEQLCAGDPQEREYFRWSIGEWDLTTVALIERGEPDDLAPALTELARVADEVSAGRVPGEDYDDFRFTVWEAVVTALSRLFDDGFFDVWPQAVQVFDVPDEDLDPATLAEWAAQINTDSAAAEFSRWLAQAEA